MYKFCTKISIVVFSCLIFSACERNGPSPVDMRIDDAAATNTHVVMNNETLYDIAYRYNVDPVNLAKINGLQPPYLLKNGQVLQLPSGDSKTGIVITESGTTPSATITGGYVAIDETVNNAEGSDIPPYIEEEQEKDKKKKKDESDEDFDSMILAESGESKNAKVSKAVEKSASNAKNLAIPKVTATAIGTPVSSSKASSKGEKGSAALSSKEKDRKTTSKSAKMRMPVEGKIISHFGDINDGISNDGINIRAKKGTSVSAAADGTVIYVGNKLDEEYGNVVIIQHDDGLITSYAHLDKATVKKDAQIHAGDIIGIVGNTGDVKESQLYFEVMKDKKPVNPSKYLKK